MKYKSTILKEAGVLLIGMLLIFSSLAVIANKNEKNYLSGSSKIDIPIKNSGLCLVQDDVILWDNYVLDWTSAYHSQDDPPGEPEQWDSYVADDFKFEEETDVHWIFWQIYYGWCNNADGPKDYHYDWNIIFFEDDGTGNNPGDIYEGPITISDEDIIKSNSYLNSTAWIGVWQCGAHAYLPGPITFDADTKYWISIYSIGPIYPLTFFPVHSESLGGILLHQGKIKSEHWGYPDWTSLSVDYGYALDSNFVLGGASPHNITISKGFGISVTIDNNLPETITPMTNVTVNFTATGGFVLNPTKNIVIPEIASQTTETAKYFPIGFGKIIITAKIAGDRIGVGTIEDTGFLILFFVI